MSGPPHLVAHGCPARLLVWLSEGRDHDGQMAHLDPHGAGTTPHPGVLHKVRSLLAKAESVEKLTAICRCGRAATRTQRLIGGHPAHYDDPVILVGATESYEPRCRSCHRVPRDERVTPLFAPVG